MNIFPALVKREFLDGYNGYFRVPAVLLAITIGLVLISAMGVGNYLVIDDLEVKGISNLGDAMQKALDRGGEINEQLPEAMTLAYWVFSFPAWMALPFVVFFSLLGSLYEERRDRSILFWKSMPVSDWQEVLAKLFMPAFGAPVIFLGIVIVAQLATALILSIIVLFQGGPVEVLWPLGTMISSWVGSLYLSVLSILWVLPLLTWLLLVSAYASRMPFMFAILPPIVLMVLEVTFFETAYFGEWIAMHLGGWQAEILHEQSIHIDGPRDILRTFVSPWNQPLLSTTFGSANFWGGIVAAAAMTFGAVELRKRAI